MENEPTIKDVMAVLTTLSEGVLDVKNGLQEVRGELQTGLQEVHEAMQALASHTDEQIRKSRVDLEHSLKDFVDRRISDAVGEIAGTIRKVDEKDSSLVVTLEKSEVINAQAAKNIMAQSPF